VSTLLKQSSTLTKRFAEPALWALAGLVAIAILMAAIAAVRDWSMARRVSQTYVQLTGVDPAALAVRVAQREEMVKRISSNRLIAPPPNLQLTGVLGDSAIFNGGQLVKSGQSTGDMKLLSIGANWVEVEKDGVTQKLYVFQPMATGGAGGPMPMGGMGRMERPPPGGGAPGATSGPVPMVPPDMLHPPAAEISSSKPATMPQHP
jgi:hypothetical protein